MAQRQHGGTGDTATAQGGGFTPENFAQFASVAEQLLRPVHTTQQNALQRRLDGIRSQAQGLRGMAEAGHQQARHNLTNQERTQWNRLTKSAEARGLGSSPLASYQQRQVAEAFAPEHQQLETQAAAQLANIAGQAAMGSEEVAAQSRALEDSFSSQVIQNALAMLMDERNRGDRLGQQNWDRGLQMLDRTTMTPMQQWEAYLRGGETFGEALPGMPDMFGQVQRPAATTTAAPAAQRPAATTRNTASYTIRRGDTLSALARQHGTTLTELLRLNPQITDPNRISAGASLRVPAR